MSNDSQDDFDVRLNEYGQPDIAFYVTKAHRLRGETIGNWMSELTTRLRQRIHLPRFGSHGQAVSH